MRIMNEKWAVGLLVIGVAVPAPVFADTVGHVVRLNPIVSVLREGKTIPLSVRDEILLDDVITTDGTGKVQVFFKDDTSVSLGNNSRAHMKEFVPSGSDSRFQLNMTQGVARVITGQIVKNNPKGFAVTTPEATVGIRGTILVITSLNGQTTIFVQNTDKEVVVGGIVIPPGFKLTLPSSSPTPEPITPADQQEIDTASQVASAAGNIITTQDNVLNVGENNLGDIPLAIETTGGDDSLLLNLAGLTTPTTPNTSGILSFGTAGTGSFSFDINLTTGYITNAKMEGTTTNLAADINFQGFSLSGGRGSYLGSITNFSTTGTYTQSGSTFTAGTESSISFSGGYPAGYVPSVGESLSGGFKVLDQSNNIAEVGSGTVSGSRVQ